MKKHPTSDFYKNNYQNLLAPVQTQILAQQTSLEKQHKEWEKQFYLNHECSIASLEDTVSEETKSTTPATKRWFCVKNF